MLVLGKIYLLADFLHDCFGDVYPLLGSPGSRNFMSNSFLSAALIQLVLIKVQDDLVLHSAGQLQRSWEYQSRLTIIVKHNTCNNI